MPIRSMHFAKNTIDSEKTGSRLVDAAVEDILPGAVIGIIALEEGVQEVCVLFVPTVCDESDGVVEENITGDIDFFTDATEQIDSEV